MNQEEREFCGDTSCCFDLRVLVFEECGVWVAQCLEYDITGQGDTADAALDGMRIAFVGHIASDADDGLCFLGGVMPAPDDMWARYRHVEHAPTDKEHAATVRCVFRMGAPAAVEALRKLNHPSGDESGGKNQPKNNNQPQSHAQKAG